MIAETVKRRWADQLRSIREAGTYKQERVIETPQSARVGVEGVGRPVLNLCANNYLGLAQHPEVARAAKAALDRWGYGMASVRFICGTQGVHQELEGALSAFLGTEATLLYSSCWDANGGIFETLLGAEDAVISDELNHASIIDGIRLCKARRLRYRNNDMADLEARLIEAKDARVRWVVTDGVFSMDGVVANLASICDLAERYGAVVMVDDSHAVGFIGPGGRGTPEQQGVMGRVDVLTGTLGKALGGASGGYVSGPAAIVDLLRQRSRPYLFSNTVAPPVAAATLRALELIRGSDELRLRLESNTKFFRAGIEAAGFRTIPGGHPIVPILLGDAAVAVRFADALLPRGVYVVGFSYPVVPDGKARIRVQVSASHEREDLRFAIEQFRAVKAQLGV